MKKTSLVLLFSTVAAGVAYASAQVVGPLVAVSLPQPGTIFICTAGAAFFRCLSRRIL